MSRNAHTPCDEPGCDRSPFKGDILFRVNPKGEKGIFMCNKHSREVELEGMRRGNR
jgi:hypothetical protein